VSVSLNAGLRVFPADARIVVGPGPRRELDFEGRRLAFSSDGDRTTLRLTGAAATVTIVWRFSAPTAVTVNGVPITLDVAGGSASVTFAHGAELRLVWR
jgi:hypothetical protein